MSGRQQRVMVQPIVSLVSIVLIPTPNLLNLNFQNVIFKNLQQVRHMLTADCHG
jgi:hypothetical protein